MWTMAATGHDAIPERRSDVARSWVRRASVPSSERCVLGVIPCGTPSCAPPAAFFRARCIRKAAAHNLRVSSPHWMRMTLPSAGLRSPPSPVACGRNCSQIGRFTGRPSARSAGHGGSQNSISSAALRGACRSPSVELNLQLQLWLRRRFSGGRAILGISYRRVQRRQ